MSKYKKGGSASSKSLDEAENIAKGIQKPGQTKEQTKLISQGIQKGIDIYKKQQNAKNRELDKNRKQADKKKINTPIKVDETNQIKQYWLPWVLLGITWVGIGIYFSL